MNRLHVRILKSAVFSHRKLRSYQKREHGDIFPRFSWKRVNKSDLTKLSQRTVRSLEFKEEMNLWNRILRCKAVQVAGS